ncbi:ADP-ribose diphosphatase [Hahella sp. SMD15-11]|uniref:ADP-ribose pyrophosphatase n=1 Tax=Thermohahella caldifontis TaxID=3142973 RepID=A0AB39UVM4_9GAMM
MTDTFTHDDVEILKREPLSDGFLKVYRYHLRHRLFRGGWSPVLTREVVVRHGASCLLPYDPVRDEVVLVEQFRVGALTSPRSPWLLELVAGIHDDGTSAEEVARREAEEEAGLTVTDILPICEFQASPGGLAEHVYLYCGRVDTSAAGGIHGLAEEGEDIRVHVMSREEAWRRLQAGELDNAPVIIAIQWLMLNLERVRKAWSGAAG